MFKMERKQLITQKMGLFDEPNTVYIDERDWIYNNGSGGVAFFDGNIWSYLDSETDYLIIMFMNYIR